MLQRALKIMKLSGALLHKVFFKEMQNMKRSSQRNNDFTSGLQFLMNQGNLTTLLNSQKIKEAQASRPRVYSMLGGYILKCTVFPKHEHDTEQYIVKYRPG